MTHAPHPRFIGLLDIDRDAAERLRIPATMILEPEIQHEIAVRSFAVHLRGSTAPLAGALAVAQFRTRDDRQLKEFAEADTRGILTFPVDPAEWSLDTLWVKPRHSYWTRVAVELEPSSTLTLEPLPGGPFGWWHQAVGIGVYDEGRGRGIRVGVLDTGCGPNRCLAHVSDIGSILSLTHDPRGGMDSDGHGTHVCGLVGARVDGDGQFSGITPGADLIAVRVCDSTNHANQADMALALDLLGSDHQVDLVNMSLAAEKGSTILRDAILDLRDRGALAICAAGNEAGPVWFPAAFVDAVAVSAIGMIGWGARAAISSGQRPDPNANDRYGTRDLYLARFSCAGPELTCAAPGVGIVSTVAIPSGEPVFAEMDGTSMASPIACAVLASRLALDARYGRMPRDAGRTARALQVLRASCVDIGLAPEFQGEGMPQCN